MHAERSITGARGINRFNRKRHTAFRALLMCDRGQLRPAENACCRIGAPDIVSSTESPSISGGVQVDPADGCTAGFAKPRCVPQTAWTCFVSSERLHPSRGSGSARRVDFIGHQTARPAILVSGDPYAMCDLSFVIT